MGENRGTDIGLTEVATILFDEYDRSSPMNAKTFHKLTYFIDKEIDELGGSFELPYFWYKFGTMTVTQNSLVTILYPGDESEVVCPMMPSNLSISPEQEKIIRHATRPVLDHHDDVGTEGLTDEMYEEAPYEAQRRYRKLDNVVQWQLYEKSEDETNFDRDEITRRMHEFIDAFPLDEFPSYEHDLFLWYDILDTRLADQDASLGDIEDIIELFWSLFSLDLAVTIDTGVDRGVVLVELGIDDLKERQRYFKNELQKLEREHLTVKTDSDHLAEAADALMASQLDFVELSEG